MSENEAGRPRKPRYVLNACLTDEARWILEAHCHLSGQTKTTAVNRALCAYYGPEVEKAFGPYPGAISGKDGEDAVFVPPSHVYSEHTEGSLCPRSV